jgi:hypothetical protein
MLILTEDSHKRLYEEHIGVLRQAQLDDNLVIFIGAGISKLTNENYPRWGEIIEILKNSLNNTTENDPLKVAQLYELEYTKYQTKKILLDIFPKVDRPGPIHKLLFSIDPHYIITTNWDTLLENEIYENALNYDIICSDSELIDSHLKKKLIKMHGDFLHDNFVFTEDDYINYPNNFPLIENFIKSIMATHIILFVGYSFGDIDLKHIINWLQRNSTNRPPAYLAIIPEQYKQTEEKYLKKFDVAILSMQKDDQDVSYEYNLLKSIKTCIPTNNYNSIEYVLSLLKPLDSFFAILRSQISDRVTNCTFIYDKYNRAVLQFTWDIVTKDKNEAQLKIYKDFVNKLLTEITENDQQKLSRIFSILQKADIHGIMLTSIMDDEQKYFNFDENHSIQYNNHSKIFDFEFTTINKKEGDMASLLQNSFALYNLENYEDAFWETKQVLKIIKRDKNYKLLFILLFNYNILLDNLKYGLQKTLGYEDEEEVDLDEEFRKLPKGEQNEIKQLLDFYKFTYLYKAAFYVHEDLKKIEKQVRTIKSGGFSFSVDANKYPAEHKNLIDFIMHNGIMIEKYIEYRNINKTYVEIAMKRQSHNTIIMLNKYEIFTCIKYFSYEELTLLFSSFFNDDNQTKRLNCQNENIEWQINIVLVNCINYYITRVYAASCFEYYIINNIYLLSFIELTAELHNKMLCLFKKIVNEAKNTMSIFEAINIFFGRQYNLYRTQFDVQGIILLIECLLEKYIQGQCNLYEHETIAHNKIFNLFPYINLLGGQFSNTDITKRLLDNLTAINESIMDLTYIAQNFLIPLYYISNNECKDYIRLFLEKYSDKDNKDTEGKLSFLISLLQIGIKNDFSEIANDLELFLQKCKETHIISSRIVAMREQLKPLVIEHPEFNNCSKLLDELIDWYNSNKMTSYI